MTAIIVRSTVAVPLMWLTYLVAVHWSRFQSRQWHRSMDRAMWLMLVFGSGILVGAIRDEGVL